MLFVLTDFLPLRVNLMNICLLIIASILVIPFYTSFDAEASSNPHLYVSAENSDFDNHFAGSMVIEVIMRRHIFIKFTRKGRKSVKTNNIVV